MSCKLRTWKGAVQFGCCSFGGRTDGLGEDVSASTSPLLSCFVTDVCAHKWVTAWERVLGLAGGALGGMD